MKSITITYDAKKKLAVLRFPNHRTLKLSNVTAEQAQNFYERHAEEFGRRDLCLQTPVEWTR